MPQLQAVFTELANILSVVAFSVVVVFIIIAGYHFITAGGSPKGAESGKQALINAAIGFLIVLMAQAIAEIIRSTAG